MTRLPGRILLLFWLALAGLPLPGHAEPSASPDAEDEPVRIGVLAKRGEAAAETYWQPTIDYLDAAVADREFRLVPLGFQDLWDAVEAGSVDFVISNPYLYVVFEQKFGATRQLTVEHRWGGVRLDSFGGVIFTRADDEGITRFEDIAGQRLMAVNERSMGGWLMARRLLHEHGVDPRFDTASLTWGGTHDAVVDAVAAGRADVGIVRTDTLERMSSQGLADMSAFRILQPEGLPLVEDFPFVRSTRLYPEWPLARLAHTPRDLAHEVSLALLQMEPEIGPTWEDQVADWTVPLDYEPVRRLMLSLEVGPYVSAPETVGETLRRHWELVAALALVLLFLIGWGVHSRRLNHQLVASNDALWEAHNTLELRVAERTRELTREVEKHSLTAEQLALSGEVIESLREGMIITEPDGSIIRVNRAFTEITGYSAEEVLGHNPSILQSGWQSEDFYRTMWATLQRDGTWQGEIWNMRKDGTVYPEWLSISNIRDAQGRIAYYIGIFFDITDRKQAEERLQYLSYYDGLTGLPNRALLMEHLEHAISLARRHGDMFAVFYLDLDRFKAVNEGMGHAAGDELLQQAARRLEGVLGPGDTLARLGGDEFCLLVEGLSGSDDATSAASRVLECLKEAFEVDDQMLYSPGSLGVVLYPHDGADVTTLLRNAESAMYQAKSEGGNFFRFYSREMNETASTRVALESQLRRSVETGEGFRLQYQPKVETTSGRIIGAEALLRWQNPAGENVSPGEFIPVLEQTGLIVELGRWIVAEASRQNRAWQAAGLPPIRMAVNLAAPQFRHEDIATTIAEILSETGLAARDLELEITESMLLADIPGVIRTLGAFRDLGVHVALDDFGTGYSSLAYLRQFPIDTLKIDRSFVSDLHQDQGGAAIARTILSLAENLGVQAVAEGVETPEQHEFLRAEACYALQGFLFARPLEAEAFAALLADEYIQQPTAAAE